MAKFVGNRAFLCYLFAGLAVVPLVANSYIVFVSNLLFIYIILAVGLNLLVGFAGQFALANAAMFGMITRTMRRAFSRGCLACPSAKD